MQAPAKLMILADMHPPEEEAGKLSTDVLMRHFCGPGYRAGRARATICARQCPRNRTGDARDGGLAPRPNARQFGASVCPRTGLGRRLLLQACGSGGGL